MNDKVSGEQTKITLKINETKQQEGAIFISSNKKHMNVQKVTVYWHRK